MNMGYLGQSGVCPLPESSHSHQSNDLEAKKRQTVSERDEVIQ